EVDRHVALAGVLQKSVYPRSGRGCGPADSQPWTDALQIARRVIVELEIALLTRNAAPKVDVGFVPDLEIPLGHLVRPEVLHQVAREGCDEAIPFLQALRRRDVGLVPEGVKPVRVKGELLRHEADFH